MSPKEYDVINGRWLLPSAVDDILPPQAERFAKMQQKILKIVLGYGYQLIQPPSVEFASALNISNSENLEEDMVHFNDYPTADVLGLRADFTPQAARIDARVLHNSGINRFCYCGEIFRAKRVSSEDMRNTVHIGAELFGDSSINSDMEIMELMLTCLRSFCKEPVVLFIGHATFAKRILQLAKLSQEQERQYLKLLSAKSMDYVDDFVRQLNLSASLRELLIQLPRLYGDRSILKKASALISKLKDKQLNAMLQQVKRSSAVMQDKTSIYIDLGEMPGNGYSYHNGLVFGAYLQNNPSCFAEGGRYDAIGEHYGKGRPATGFSMDAKKLFYYINGKTSGKASDGVSSHKQAVASPVAGLIFAPYIGDGINDAAPKDAALKKEVAALRSSGKRVVCALNKKQNAKELNCAKELIYSGRSWKVKSLT